MNKFASQLLIIPALAVVIYFGLTVVLPALQAVNPVTAALIGK